MEHDDWDARQYLRSIRAQADDMDRWTDRELEAVRPQLIAAWWTIPDDRVEAQGRAELAER